LKRVDAAYNCIGGKIGDFCMKYKKTIVKDVNLKQKKTGNDFRLLAISF